MALKTTCIKNVKCQIKDYQNKERSVQYARYFYYSENLNWAAPNLPLGRMRATGWTRLLYSDMQL